jgi:hypothetical protein
LALVSAVPRVHLLEAWREDSWHQQPKAGADCIENIVPHGHG